MTEEQRIVMVVYDTAYCMGSGLKEWCYGIYVHKHDTIIMLSLGETEDGAWRNALFAVSKEVQEKLEQ